MPLILPPPAPPAAIPPEQQAVALLSAIAKQQFQQLLAAWQRSIDAIWKNGAATPQEVMGVMGTDAKNNFAASALTGTYLAQTSPLIFDAATDAANQAAITAALAVIGQYTVNADGSITVNPPADGSAAAPASPAS